MNTVKFVDFFNPDDVKVPVHIIGCGAIGSTVGENLARLGLTNITLWDFDIVESKNIANQMFRNKDIGKPKVEALKDIMGEINPDILRDIKLKPEGWNGERLTGYVFMAVDSVKIRKEIIAKNKFQKNLKAVFDFRMGLTEAQHYAARWNDMKEKDDLINSMNFTDEEAKAETPVSACNLELSIAPTVRNIVALGVSNFINLVKTQRLRKVIIMDSFDYELIEF